MRPVHEEIHDTLKAPDATINVFNHLDIPIIFAGHFQKIVAAMLTC